MDEEYLLARRCKTASRVVTFDCVPAGFFYHISFGVTKMLLESSYCYEQRWIPNDAKARRPNWCDEKTLDQRYGLLTKKETKRRSLLDTNSSSPFRVMCKVLCVCVCACGLYFSCRRRFFIYLILYTSSKKAKWTDVLPWFFYVSAVKGGVVSSIGLVGGVGERSREDDAGKDDDEGVVSSTTSFAIKGNKSSTILP